jgi:phosphoribosylformylglycinamidine synthase
MGICNGFQILLEAGLLPGIMLKNKSLQFVCKDVYLTVENRSTVFSKETNLDKKLKLPVAHGDGNYFADEKTLKNLVENKQIVFKYSSRNGEKKESDNPNGSVMNIAGIINKRGNILGMMPHPERSCNPILGKTDGVFIFNSLAKSILN